MQRRFLSKMLLGFLAVAVTAVASAPSLVMVSSALPALVEGGQPRICSIEVNGIWK